jgi:hypothetical protein
LGRLVDAETNDGVLKRDRRLGSVEQAGSQTGVELLIRTWQRGDRLDAVRGRPWYRPIGARAGEGHERVIIQEASAMGQFRVDGGWAPEQDEDLIDQM